MAKMTGLEEIKLTNIQKIKIDNAVNAVLNDITTDILEENGISEQDDPDNTVYWRIYTDLKGKLANKLIYSVWPEQNLKILISFPGIDKMSGFSIL